jgi:hypothetical protein
VLSRDTPGQSGYATTIVRERQFRTVRPQIHIKPMLGDVNPDIAWYWFIRLFHRNPSLQYGLEALATVRDSR